jgi:hypothetical protein
MIDPVAVLVGTDDLQDLTPEGLEALIDAAVPFRRAAERERCTGRKTRATAPSSPGTNPGAVSGNQ